MIGRMQAVAASSIGQSARTPEMIVHNAPGCEVLGSSPGLRLPDFASAYDDMIWRELLWGSAA